MLHHYVHHFQATPHTVHTMSVLRHSREARTTLHGRGQHFHANLTHARMQVLRGGGVSRRGRGR